MAELAVIPKAQLPPGTHLVVQAGDQEIGIYNIDGTVHAVRNRCPHQLGPVGEGGLFENVKANVAPNGRVREWIEDEGCILACPWHGWEFDIRSGTCLWNNTYHLRKYSVHENEDGEIVISS